AIAFDDATHLEPLARVDTGVDVQIEAFALGSHSRDPDCALGISQDEVVLVSGRRRGDIAEQVPAPELTGNCYRLSFVPPRFQGDRSDPRPAIRRGLCESWYG